MAFTLGNKCAKNCCKRTILVQLIVKNVATCLFLRHSVVQQLQEKHMKILETTIKQAVQRPLSWFTWDSRCPQKGLEQILQSMCPS